MDDNNIIVPADLKQDNSPMALVAAAIRGGLDVSVIERLTKLQEQQDDRAAKKAFNAAMSRAQANMPTIPEDQKNTQTDSTYSSMKMILKYAKPVYTKEGFSVSFYEGDAKNENDVRVFADIMHKAGHTETRWADIPFDDSGIKGRKNKTRTHAKGSSFSYGRSYLSKLIWNLPTGDDDDGNAAGGGGPVDYITDSEKSQLVALMDKYDDVMDNELDRDALLKKLGAQSLDAIPKTPRFAHYIKRLDEKVEEAERGDN